MASNFTPYYGIPLADTPEETNQMQQQIINNLQNNMTNQRTWTGTSYYAGTAAQVASQPVVLPMGVLQWKEHGMKHGYWDYFKDQVIREEKAKPQHPPDKVHVTPWNAP